MSPRVGACFFRSSIMSMVASTSAASSPGTPTIPYSFSFSRPPSYIHLWFGSECSKSKSGTSSSLSGRARVGCRAHHVTVYLGVHCCGCNFMLFELLIDNVPHPRRPALNCYGERLGSALCAQERKATIRKAATFGERDNQGCVGGDNDRRDRTIIRRPA